MAYGAEQLEPGLWKQVLWDPEKPWKTQGTKWRKYNKKAIVRRERQRVRQDVECEPEYKRYDGWEY